MVRVSADPSGRTLPLVGQMQRVVKVCCIKDWRTRRSKRADGACSYWKHWDDGHEEVHAPLGSGHPPEATISRKWPGAVA